MYIEQRIERLERAVARILRLHIASLEADIMVTSTEVRRLKIEIEKEMRRKVRAETRKKRMKKGRTRR